MHLGKLQAAKVLFVAIEQRHGIQVPARVA
jgi:hypothetical protein